MTQIGLRTLLKDRQMSPNMLANMQKFTQYKKTMLLEKFFYSTRKGFSHEGIPQIVAELPNYIKFFEELMNANNFYISFNNSKKTIKKEQIITRYNETTWRDITNNAINLAFVRLYNLEKKQELIQSLSESPLIKKIIQELANPEGNNQTRNFYSLKECQDYYQNEINKFNDKIQKIQKTIKEEQLEKVISEDKKLKFFQKFSTEELFDALIGPTFEEKLIYWNSKEYSFLVGPNKFNKINENTFDETNKMGNTNNEGQQVLYLLSHLAHFVNPKIYQLSADSPYPINNPIKGNLVVLYKGKDVSKDFEKFYTIK